MSPEEERDEWVESMLLELTRLRSTPRSLTASMTRDLADRTITMTRALLSDLRGHEAARSGSPEETPPEDARGTGQTN